MNKLKEKNVLEKLENARSRFPNGKRQREFKKEGAHKEAEIEALRQDGPKMMIDFRKLFREDCVPQVALALNLGGRRREMRAKDIQVSSNSHEQGSISTMFNLIRQHPFG